MTKKIKNRKAGMKRRQQDKRHKKMLRRRKMMSTHPAGQITSASQIQGLFRSLPNLAFDPVLKDLHLDEPRMKGLIDEGVSEPIMLMKLLNKEFLTQLDERLEELENSVVPQSPKSVLAQASRHQLENSEKIPHLSNPLLFAFYLKTRAKVDGVPMELPDLPEAMKEFEERNSEWFAQAAEDPSLLKQDEPIDVAALPDQQVAETPEMGVAPTPILDAENLAGLTLSLNSIPEDKRQRMSEYLELFMEDFEPPPVSRWSPDLFDEFLGKWFINNANPLEEDLESMQETMLHLLTYLQDKTLLPSCFEEHHLTKLKDPKAFSIQDAASG